MHISARYILLTIILSVVAIYGLKTFKPTHGQTPDAVEITDGGGSEGVDSLSPTSFRVAFKSSNGRQMLAEGGGGAAVNATSTWIREWETFTLVDLNGGQLQSGDRVNIQTADGHYLCAEGGGGAELNATRMEGREWETFTIWKPDGKGSIIHGDVVALQTSNGYYVVAEGGGGDVVNANRTAVGPWERFTFIESNTSYRLDGVAAPAVASEYGVVTGAIESDASPFPSPNPQSLRTDGDQAMREFKVGLGAKWIRIEADRNGSDVTAEPLASTYRRIVERAHGQGLKVIVVLSRRYCTSETPVAFSTNYKNRLADIHRLVFTTNESKPDAYEISNEPNMWESIPCNNNEMGWRIPGHVFAKLLETVWAWKVTLPSTPTPPKIISGGTHNVYHRTDPHQLLWWDPFFEQLDAQNTGRPFDFFGVHPYNYRDIDRNCLNPKTNPNWYQCFDQSPGWWQTRLINLLHELPQLIEDATDVAGTQLYATEFGWQVHPGECPPNVFCGVYTDQQAGVGMEIYHNTLSPSLIPVALWYNYRDGGGETFGLRGAWNGSEYPPKPYVWDKFSTIAGGAGDPNVFWPPNPCYPDVSEGSTFHTYIHNLSHRAIVDAYPNDPQGNFLPDTIATRAIYAKWIVRAMNWPIINPPVARFSDVPTDHPYYQYIETAVSHGIAGGYTCGNNEACFRPSNPLTRGQASKMISIAMGWPLIYPDTPRFTDVLHNHTFYTHVETVAGHGVVSGYSDGTFRPDNLLTRGQASKIIWNSISAVGMQYQAHVQYAGWQNWRANWETAGTTGQNSRMEALKIQLANSPNGMGVCYQAHVQNYGWMSEVCNGQQAGTTGQELRMEALKVRLINPPSGKRICYQAHVQNYGWMGEVCDGEQAGTTGQNLRIEAVRLRVIQ